MKYIVTQDFINGEAPEGASKPYTFKKGQKYNGGDAESLLADGLIEPVEEAPVTEKPSDLPTGGDEQVPPAGAGENVPPPVPTEAELKAQKAAENAAKKAAKKAEKEAKKAAAQGA
jgi:hypothetical protein